MHKADFAHLMEYPVEWLEWDMYPDELFEKQLSLHQPGDERAAEHYRNGSFHWWLKQSLTADQLEKLVALSFKDPDPLMADDVRKYIARRTDLPQEIRELLTKK